MRHPLANAFALAAALLSLNLSAAPDPAEETALIGILQSDSSSLQAKDAACARLKLIATPRAVPALAALLSDPELSHSARYALEPMADPAAGEALRQALLSTPDPARLGVVDSLGQRRDPQAVPLLAPFLSSPNAPLAAAAAIALGQIGSPEAIALLQSAMTAPSDALQPALSNALLEAARQLLAEGKRAAAQAIFQPLCDDRYPESTRVAAYSGVFNSAGDRAPVLILQALQGTNRPAQFAAVPLVRTASSPGFLQALKPLLLAATPPVQIALVEALAQRDDPAAAPAVLTLADSTAPGVRDAAVRALGPLGDANCVPVLVAAATSPDPALQKAGRDTLTLLHRGPVTETLLAQLPTTRGPAQNEIIRALSSRAETTAIPRLIEYARGDDPALRTASLRALATLASNAQVPALAMLVLDAPDDSAAAEAEGALTATCQRGFDSGKPPDPAPILQALARTSAPAANRAQLIRTCSLFVDPAVCQTLRNCTQQDQEPVIRDAAFRALCDSRDPAVLPDLLSLAKSSPTPALHALAIRGYVRLATDPDIRPALPQPPALLLHTLLPAATSPEDKRILLSGLATLPDPKALNMVVPFLEDPALRLEAVQAAIQICTPLAATEPALVRTSLVKVISTNPDPAQRLAAQTTINQIDAIADYLTAWEVAGPYRQAGKGFAELFEIPFPPETSEAATVTWSRLPSNTDPARPFVLDLLKALGGEQCVAYVRTTIRSDKDQAAILELGTDDGVKAWLNGTVVHSNNTARPLQAGVDKVPVQLRAGPNVLLLKITQNNVGWEFCTRFTHPDGSRLTVASQP